MRVHLDASDSRPIYVQIMDEVRRGLLRGTLGPEDPLPSVRELASSLRINPRTVLQAYAALEREGVVYVRRGQGTFVSADIKPDQRERPLLALEVAKRALAEARRSGLTRDDLLDAFRELGEASPESERPEGGEV
jgi:GntR family transcriptional regulator